MENNNPNIKVAVSPSGARSKTKISLPVRTGTQLLTLKVSEEDLWFVEKLIPGKALTILTGASDCSKSTLVRNLAIIVASGAKEFLGKRIITSKTKVLYVSTEDADVSTFMVLKKHAAALGISNLDDLIFCFGAEDIQALIKEQCEEGPALVVIDTLADCITGNPNDMINVRQQLDKYMKICHKYDCPVICLHHNGKNSEGKIPHKNLLNGSQAFEAKARCVLELRKDQGSITHNSRSLTIVKCNYLPESEKKASIPLLLDPDSLILSVAGQQNPVQYGFALDDINDNWYEAFVQLRMKGLSFDKCRKELIRSYPHARIPGTTKLKELGNQVHKGDQFKE